LNTVYVHLIDEEFTARANDLGAAMTLDIETGGLQVALFVNTSRSAEQILNVVSEIARTMKDRENKRDADHRALRLRGVLPA
jgi:hypothetical protein